MEISILKKLLYSEVILPQVKAVNFKGDKKIEYM